MIKPHLDKDIRYIGEVDFKTKIKLYQGALATLFPIQEPEALGNVLIESMACGTPVIGFDIGATKEAIKDGENGFLVRSGDIKGMAQAIKNVNKIDRQKVRQWAEKKFDTKIITEQYEKMYESR